MPHWPAAAFDAALITGGLPLICSEWRCSGLQASYGPEELISAWHTA
ncbi:hypothetical protein [Streptomyces sp. RerS4]|nr:hypothetical protein [Streptomyces sp. RerS4]UQX02129.1 hypothetical protein M4D82_17705 [Streptomyces sp. RerS4]